MRADTIARRDPHGAATRGSVLLVVPVHNEEGSLNSLLSSLERHWQSDHLAIDDGSTDHSNDVLHERWGGAVITSAINEGYGAAVTKGLEHARRNGYEYLLLFDADRQHDPQSIGAFLELAGTADIVSGSRYLPASARLSSVPRLREMGNRLYRKLMGNLTGLHLTDVWCGMRLMSVARLAGLHVSSAGYEYPLEFWPKVARMGLTIREVPVPLVYFDRDFKRDTSTDVLRTTGTLFLSTFLKTARQEFGREERRIIEEIVRSLVNGDFPFDAQERHAVQEVLEGCLNPRRSLPGA